MTVQSPALEDILNSWHAEASASDFNRSRHKGLAFEQFCQAFITHDEVQKMQYEPPLTYAEWASREGLPAQDIGIDLVAKMRNAEGWCAIQCKFYARGRSVRKGDIDSFLAASSRKYFSHRLIMDTTGKDWSPQLMETIRNQDPEVIRITLKDFRESSIDWVRYLETRRTFPKEPPKMPRPHQEEAIQKVTAGLAEPGTRGTLLMACGTGKTYTSLRIAEDIAGAGGHVLVLVPSLALMSQTVQAWAADTRLPLRSHAVCSDSQVGRRKRRNDDRIDLDVLDLSFPAMTDAGKLAERVSKEASGQMTVIFATYHSLPVVGVAQQEHGLPDFDLAICDEAHRTAGAQVEGEEDSHFVQIHDQNQIRAHRRLYMTATPKVYPPSARNRAGKANATLYSMGNREVYGPVLYEIGFGTAVDAGLLTDYKVIVLTVPEEGVAYTMGDTLGDSELTLDDAGKLIGCWRALSKIDREEFGEDHEVPMQRAIAYCRSIKASEQIVKAFPEVARGYQESQDHSWTEYGIASDHVDGTFQAVARADRLRWLDSVEPQDRVCHVLSNVRCLSEGVDIPSLDAILFMHPRKSQIEVVQAVGRVMREFAGKKMGYVVLPVVIPAGEDATVALNDNKTFQVVWQVLNAIRSHDERFAAMLNLIEEGKPIDRLSIIAISDWKPSGSSGGGHDPPPLPPPIPIPTLFPEAIRAKIVEKCGNRRYWDEWAVDVAEIARKHIVRITDMVNRNEAAQEVFDEFLAELRDDLNDGITKEDAIEMLAQHMVTRPVFEALHGDAKFVDQNPISRGMQLVLDVLKPANIEVEAESLGEFYASVARRAKAARTRGARQRIITELYDKFFRNAFPKTAERLGIVYTPVELVDFILYSVDALLQDEFGESLSSEGVGILDPFTGTGTFITRMIQNGLIAPELLRKKYHTNIHANEIMLLAYYIAAVNIEEAYQVLVEPEEYQRFAGIVLTDTFDMQYREDEIAELMQDNSEQRKRQKEAKIWAIVGNPPWSKGQRSENDDARNQSYPKLNQRIDDTYASFSVATNKNSLYDSYILAIRWASDRIGERGVIGFVTNAGWLEGIAMDGMRKCLVREFTSIYVLNLRGQARTQGERRRKEGGNVFGSGSRAPVSVLLLVKNPERTGCTIRYHDIGDYLSREEKLKKVKEFGGIQGVDWEDIIPNDDYDWLNQREEGFGKFMALGDKRNRNVSVIFQNYSGGVKTNRDAWCYNYSEIALRENIRRMIRFYHAERERLVQGNTTGSSLTPAEVTRLVDNDPTKISWTRALKNDLRRNKELNMEEGRITTSQYRPFTPAKLYFSRQLNEMVYQMPQIFPHADAENLLICVTGKGAGRPFSALMVNQIPDLQTMFNCQCYPLWLYGNGDEDSTIFTDSYEADSHGYAKRSAITDDALRKFQKNLGDEIISPEDLFYYIYGVLHVPHYRTRYANNLRIELPRIPLPKDAAQFWMLAEAGRNLGVLHVGYEEVQEYPIEFAKGGWEPKDGTPSEDWFRVGNRSMQHPGKARQKDQSCIMYNDHITIKGIPPEAHDYVVNGKPAIAWIMERQRVKTDRDSQIVNDANRFAIETMKDPAYPLRLLAKVITVSLETNRIVDTLREVEFES